MKHTEETKQKISEGVRKAYAELGLRAKVSEGVRKSRQRPEVREKISAGLKRWWAAQGCAPAEHRAFYEKLRKHGYTRAEALAMIRAAR